MSSVFENIRIILIGTTHPGNIGAAARAMKTMMQDTLYLVKPKVYPSAEATARAAGADDILAKAKVCGELREAIADCELVVGTSARIRSVPWPMYSPRECAKKIASGNYNSVAILFGKESSGLSNEEIELCNRVVQIPTNPEYSSLNIASAVQIICYEIMLSHAKKDIAHTMNIRNNLVTHEKMEHFYKHVEECIRKARSDDKENAPISMYRIRRIFNRIEMDKAEYNILRGFLSKMTKKE